MSKHQCPYCKQEQDSISGTSDLVDGTFTPKTVDSKIQKGDPSICFNCCRVAVFTGDKDQLLREVTVDDVIEFTKQKGLLSTIKNAILDLPDSKNVAKATALAHMTSLVTQIANSNVVQSSKPVNLVEAISDINFANATAIFGMINEAIREPFEDNDPWKN